jgi:hypothetical protein
MLGRNLPANPDHLVSLITLDRDPEKRKIPTNTRINCGRRLNPTPDEGYSGPSIDENLPPEGVGHIIVNQCPTAYVHFGYGKYTSAVVPLEELRLSYQEGMERRAFLWEESSNQLPIAEVGQRLGDSTQRQQGLDLRGVALPAGRLVGHDATRRCMGASALKENSTPPAHDERSLSGKGRLTRLTDWALNRRNAAQTSSSCPRQIYPGHGSRTRNPHHRSPLFGSRGRRLSDLLAWHGGKFRPSRG